MDEVGIFVSPELPIVYDWYFNAAAKLGSLDEYKRSWAAAITRHRNHPSILDCKSQCSPIWLVVLALCFVTGTSLALMRKHFAYTIRGHG